MVLISLASINYVHRIKFKCYGKLHTLALIHFDNNFMKISSKFIWSNRHHEPAPVSEKWTFFSRNCINSFHKFLSYAKNINPYQRICWNTIFVLCVCVCVHWNVNLGQLICALEFKAIDSSYEFVLTFFNASFFHFSSLWRSLEFISSESFWEENAFSMVFYYRCIQYIWFRYNLTNW